MTDTKYKNVVLITGASSGIGLASAQKYLKKGYTVIGLDKDTVSAVDFPVLYCDISDSQSIDRACEEIDALCESVKYLVNCAGIFYQSVRNKIQSMNLDEWNDVLRTNLTGMMLVTKKVLPYMRKTGGDKAIVNISSDQAYYPRPKNTAYMVSKGGIVCFSKACAVEFLEYGIRVNVVEPASVRTNFIKKFAGDLERMGMIYERENIKMPLGIIEPEDVAETIYYLGSEHSRKITGQEILINSGLYL